MPEKCKLCADKPVQIQTCCASVWISLRTPFFQHRSHIITGGGGANIAPGCEKDPVVLRLHFPPFPALSQNQSIHLSNILCSLLSCVYCSTTLFISPSSHFTTISYSASKLFSCTPIKNMLDLLDYQSFTHWTNVCIINKFCAYPSYSKTVQGPLWDASIEHGDCWCDGKNLCVNKILFPWWVERDLSTEDSQSPASNQLR